jgi:hypothetical protein
MPMSSPKMTRMLGFFACAKELAVETARVTAIIVVISLVFIGDAPAKWIVLS